MSTLPVRIRPTLLIALFVTALNLPVQIDAPNAWANHLQGYDGVGIWDWQNHQAQIQSRLGDDATPFGVAHGRNDNVIEWSSQGQPAYAAFNAGRQAWGGQVTDNEHSWESFAGLPPNLDLDGSSTPFFGLQAVKNESVPGLSNAGGDPPLPPQSAGSYNRSIEWSASWNNWDGAPIDTTAQWRISLRTTDNSTQTVDVTPRRLQRFTAVPNATYRWENRRVNGDDLVASGEVTADGNDVVTVTGFQVTAGGNRLLLEPVGGPGATGTPTPTVVPSFTPTPSPTPTATDASLQLFLPQLANNARPTSTATPTPTATATEAPTTIPTATPTPTGTGEPGTVYDGYIVLNRGLNLNDVIDRVEVGTGSAVWIVDPSAPATSLRRVTPVEEASSLMPSWGPGYARIVFASNRGGDFSVDPSPFLDIWTIKPDGSDLWRFTQNAGHNWTPAWSPGGDYIAFASSRRAAPGQEDEASSFDLFVMNADGSDQRLLYAGPDLDEDPVFSADSQMVYFVAANTATGAYRSEIWQVPTAGGTAEPLRDSGGAVVLGEDVSLAPDGGSLFFWANGQLRSIDLSTRQIRDYSFNAIEPWIDPDGRRFTFISDDFTQESGGDVMISALDGSGAVRVSSSGDAFFPRWAAP